jgi:hypothetical protein
MHAPEMTLGTKEALFEDGSNDVVETFLFETALDGDPDLAQQSDEVVLVKAGAQEWLTDLELHSMEEDKRRD